LDFGNLTESDISLKLRNSYDLLYAGLMTSPSVTKQEQQWISQFFTLDFYMALFGMFDLNSQSVIIPSALQIYWEELQTNQSNNTSNTQRDTSIFPTIKEMRKVAENLEALKQQHFGDEDQDEENEEMVDNEDIGPVFESVQGIAIFPLESLTNVIYFVVFFFSCFTSFILVIFGFPFFVL
jgi:hypothetical protein